MADADIRMKQSRNARGFTMIELLAVIAILGILSTMAAPSFRSFIVSQRIKSASFDIMSSLIMARSEAIKRNALVDIVPKAHPVTGVVSWSSGWDIVSPSGSSTILQSKSALQGVSDTGLTVTCYYGTTAGACQTITYNGNGRLNLTGNAPSIQIVASDASTATGFGTRCIYLDLSGRPSSKKANCP